MWSWNQCVLMVSRQSPRMFFTVSPTGIAARGSLALVLIESYPASCIGQR